MIKLLWKLFHKKFLRYYASQQSKPVTHAALEKIFVDSEGDQYYKFPELMVLPLERFGKLQEFMKWMSVALTGDELNMLLDEAEKALTTGLTTNKGAAKIGAIISQIRERKNMAIPTELLYNYLAVQVIREDEPVEFFNNAIHLEKIEQFKREVASGKSYDFFMKAGLKTLSDFFNMSEKEWNEYWQEAEAMTKVIEETLKIYSSETSLSETKKK